MFQICFVNFLHQREKLQILEIQIKYNFFFLTQSENPMMECYTCTIRNWKIGSMYFNLSLVNSYAFWKNKI